MLLLDDYGEVVGETCIPNAVWSESYLPRVVVVAEERWIGLVIHGLDIDYRLIIAFLIVKLW